MKECNQLQFTFHFIGAVDKEASKLLEKLIEETRDHIGADNFKQFDNVQWSSNGGTNEESLKDYLEEFGSIFENKIKELIDRVSYLT